LSNVRSVRVVEQQEFSTSPCGFASKKKVQKKSTNNSRLIAMRIQQTPKMGPWCHALNFYMHRAQWFHQVSSNSYFLRRPFGNTWIATLWWSNRKTLMFLSTSIG
jgi:hypothetical protein